MKSAADSNVFCYQVAWCQSRFTDSPFFHSFAHYIFLYHLTVYLFTRPQFHSDYTFNPSELVPASHVPSLMAAFCFSISAFQDCSFVNYQFPCSSYTHFTRIHVHINQNWNKNTMLFVKKMYIQIVLL